VSTSGTGTVEPRDQTLGTVTSHEGRGDTDVSDEVMAEVA
jgi:hypothetical protein